MESQEIIIKREKQKRAKGIYKSEPPRRAPNVERTFSVPKRYGIGRVRLRRWQTYRHYILAAVPRASNNRFNARICHDGTMDSARK